VYWVTQTSEILSQLFDKMSGCFGPQHWWPGETPCEMLVGAILTQNTSWLNVEEAIANLKSRAFLNPSARQRIDLSVLAELIRPAGYFRVKAKRLKNLVQFLTDECDQDVERLRSYSLSTLREKLLQVHGVGPETADSILLYALNQPIFVVDQYTYRILTRHF